MERIFNTRKLVLSLLFLALIGTKTYAAGVYNWTGEKDIGNWPGLSSYEDGWSEWNTSVPNDVTMYVKAAVYLPVNSWRDDGCETYTKQVITLGSTVRKEEGSYTKYISWSNSYSACNSYDDVTHKTSCGECGCNSGYSGDSDSGCGSERHYCYKVSSDFKSVNDKSNWRTSLSAAGGYGQKVYVYLYPLRVYINYDGSGATSICGNGDTTLWTSGSNLYNSNTSIKYELGNPVCSTSFTNKSMPTASNSNSTTYILAASEGNLKENEYYRIGYDFKGWATIANGAVKFKDKQSVTASNLNARGGDTITLYAVWGKHNYQVTYSYLCGSINNVTYQYGIGVTLKDLNTSSMV